MKDITHGVLKGEQCNRNGCAGIIDEHEKEGGCSCHINPPCSYCTTDTAYCPVCGWDCGEEVDTPVDPEVAKGNQEYYAKQLEAFKDDEDRFNRLFSGKEKIEKLEVRYYSHSNSSMLKKGVFPPGTETRDSIVQREEGTFGGRFQMFDSKMGRFEYIAYTD